jgi:hypothetical protein
MTNGFIYPSSGRREQERLLLQGTLSSRVDLDRRGHAGQDTDAIRYLTDRMRTGTRCARRYPASSGVSDVAFGDPNCSP